MGGRHPEGNITDPRNTTMEEKSRRQRRMATFSEGGRAQQGLYTDGG
jgi:hypothetical protein